MLPIVQSSGRGMGILDAKASVSGGAAYQPCKAYDDVRSGRSAQTLLNMQPRCIPAHTRARAHTPAACYGGETGVRGLKDWFG